MTCGGLSLLQELCSFSSAFSSPLELACLEGAEEVEDEVVEEVGDAGEDGSPAFSPPAQEDLLMEATAAAAAAEAPPLREFLGRRGLLIQYSLLQDVTGRARYSKRCKKEKFSKTACNHRPMSGLTLSLHLES